MYYVCSRLRCMLVCNLDTWWSSMMWYCTQYNNHTCTTSLRLRTQNHTLYLWDDFHEFLAGKWPRYVEGELHQASDAYTCRVDSRLAPSQWKTSLQSSTVSHWLGANLESALYMYNHSCLHVDIDIDSALFNINTKTAQIMWCDEINSWNKNEWPIPPWSSFGHCIYVWRLTAGVETTKRKKRKTSRDSIVPCNEN